MTRLLFDCSECILNVFIELILTVPIVCRFVIGTDDLCLQFKLSKKKVCIMAQMVRALRIGLFWDLN